MGAESGKATASMAETSGTSAKVIGSTRGAKRGPSMTLKGSAGGGRVRTPARQRDGKGNAEGGGREGGGLEGGGRSLGLPSGIRPRVRARGARA